MSDGGCRVGSEVIFEAVKDQHPKRSQADEPDQDFQANDGALIHSTSWLEIFFQIHAVVEAGDLVSIAVEHQGRLPLLEERCADAAFGLLAPAGMVDIG